MGRPPLDVRLVGAIVLAVVLAGLVYVATRTGADEPSAETAQGGPARDASTTEGAPPSTDPDGSASPRGSSATPEPSTLTRDGWTLVDDPANFGGPGVQAAAAATVTDVGVVLLGVDAANGDGGRVRPGVWISFDGERWRRTTSDQIGISDAWADAGVLMQGVAAGEHGVLLAVGYANFEPETEPATWSSVDGGRTWQAVEVDYDRALALHAVIWATYDSSDPDFGHFLVLGDSTDGPAAWIAGSSAPDPWLRHPAPAEGGFHEVALHEHRLIAASTIGDSSQLWVAEAAVAPTWQEVDLPADGVVSGLSSEGARIYAVGTTRPDGLDHEGVLLVSDDGMTWQVDPRSDDLGGPGEQLPADVLVVGDDLFVVGQDRDRAAIWVSEAGGPLEPLDSALFPDASHAATIVASERFITVAGSVEREDGPDVLLWHRRR